MKRSSRPINELLELLGRRWALRVLWELRDEALSFRALRERTGGVSPSVLNERLGELRTIGVVESSPEGYALTARGRTLGKLLLPLNAWAERELGR